MSATDSCHAGAYPGFCLKSEGKKFLHYKKSPIPLEHIIIISIFAAIHLPCNISSYCGARGILRIYETVSCTPDTLPRDVLHSLRPYATEPCQTKLATQGALWQQKLNDYDQYQTNFHCFITGDNGRDKLCLRL